MRHYRAHIIAPSGLLRRLLCQPIRWYPVFGCGGGYVSSEAEALRAIDAALSGL